jgi:hypothetical protein
MSVCVTVGDSGFHGRSRKFVSYYNQDSIHYTGTCCGQAAVYSAYHTMLDHNPDQSFSDFVKSRPPDNFFGALGTSPNLMKSMLFLKSLGGEKRHGRASLKRTLRHRPAVVCLDVNKIDSTKIGLHWVCVFGYSDDHFYVSNWPTNKIRTNPFREAWSAPLVYVCGMSKTYFKA